MNNIDFTFGKRLKKLIKKRGYNQKEFAKKMGILESRLSNFIKNKRFPDDWELMGRMADNLHTTIDYLVRGKYESFSEFLYLYDNAIEECQRGAIALLKEGQTVLKKTVGDTNV